jgi:hypothetical protein
VLLLLLLLLFSFFRKQANKVLVANEDELFKPGTEFSVKSGD